MFWFTYRKRHNAGKTVVLLDLIRSEDARSVVEGVAEGIALAAYEYQQYKKSSASPKQPRRSFVLCAKSFGSKHLAKSLVLALQRAESTIFARDLVNAPPSDLQPRNLVASARSLAAKKGSKISQKTFNQTQLAKIGANALLAVSRGSDAPPFMTHLTYKPSGGAKRRKRIVLIGKGVTYDSGGLSIKSRDGLVTMKCDLAGAACVLGVMHAISKLAKEQRPVHEIHAIVPTSENMINGESVKPGDVVKAINGKTIEILNTNAEGSLLLADALSYSKRINADFIIDVATLTGACVSALGSKIAGVFTDDNELRDLLIGTAEEVGEKLWRLPLGSDYRDAINSNVADIKNIGSGGAPGATTAALFLKEFVPENTRWAHLDIAGPAFIERGNEYVPAGGTGFGVRTLLSFINKL